MKKKKKILLKYPRQTFQRRCNPLHLLPLRAKKNWVIRGKNGCTKEKIVLRWRATSKVQKRRSSLSLMSI